MKNVSFGKEEDFPIPKRIDEDLNDENDLDLEDENENEKMENDNINKNGISKENNKFSPKQYKEFELNPDDPNNKKLIFDSESEEDDDSDKTYSENEEKYKNRNINKNNEKKGKEEKIKIKEKKKKKEYDEEVEENEEKEEQSEEKSEEEDKKVLKNKKIKNNINKNINETNNEEEKEEDYSKKQSTDKEIEDMLIKSINNKENVTSQKIHMAEEIKFKSIPSNIIKTDQFGFLITDENDKSKSDEYSSFNKSSDLLQINARMEKWNYMIKNYNEFYKKNFGKLKSRTRKGVPDCYVVKCGNYLRKRINIMKKIYLIN